MSLFWREQRKNRLWSIVPRRQPKGRPPVRHERTRNTYCRRPRNASANRFAPLNSIQWDVSDGVTDAKLAAARSCRALASLPLKGFWQQERRSRAKLRHIQVGTAAAGTLTRGRCNIVVSMGHMVAWLLLPCHHYRLA